MAQALYTRQTRDRSRALLVAAGGGERAVGRGGESGLAAFWATGHG
jgi:hypothetical protein